MQIVDANSAEKTFYFTPEASSVNEVWLMRVINQTTGEHFDNFGVTTDLGYCYEVIFEDVDGFMNEGETYILEVYSNDNQRLIYRTLIHNTSSTPSEELSNNFETI